MEYGCVDLIEGAHGHRWFLEINPSGPFLYIEIETGMPLAMAMAMARLLAERSHLERPPGACHRAVSLTHLAASGA
jgi:hypothetical protein